MPEATSSIHKTGCFPAWETTQRDSQYTADGEHMDCQFFIVFLFADLNGGHEQFSWRGKHSF